MISDKGFFWFGYFPGMEYNDYRESFQDYRHYKNSIERRIIRDHILSLKPALVSIRSKDIFSGEEIPIHAGMYMDGCFLFPTDFLYYFDKYGIGIPPEYEKYLIEEVGLK